MLLYYTCAPTRVDPKDDPCLLRDIEGLASGEVRTINVKTQVQTEPKNEVNHMDAVQQFGEKMFVFYFILAMVFLSIFSIKKYGDYKKTNEKNQRDAD